MGESNTVVSAYTLYRHLQQYCSLPLKYLSVDLRSATCSVCSDLDQHGFDKSKFDPNMLGA